jgi:metallo-beta-lactamase family protein
MKIEFVGAARTVTGSSYIIKNESFTIMVDCGMFQGTRELRERNHLKLIYAPEEIDALVVTHAHIDHSGLIPKLVKEGFKGPIFATSATVDLLRVMLPDSAHIQEMDAEWFSRRRKKAGREAVEPLYTQDDAVEAIKALKPIAYGEDFEVVPGVKARFRDAGHILGSAFIEMWVTEKGETKKIVFSGDIGPRQQAIIKNAEQIEDADYLLIESTYGDRLHKSKPDTYNEFKAVINETYNRKGNIVIPSFAVERTQEIVFTLRQLFAEGSIPKIPVYIDSPLAVNATEIFIKHPDCFNDDMMKIIKEGGTPLDFPNLHYVRTTEESKRLNDTAKGSIIISASGMCTAGRIKYHLQNNLYKSESSVIFVGYQAEGTLGRMLVDGAKLVRVYAESVVVNAKIHTLGGFSGHADRDALLEWMSSIKNPKLHVFVVHGEDKAAESFAQTVKDRFGVSVSAPAWGEIIDLNTMKSEVASYGDAVTETVRAPVEDAMDEIGRLYQDIAERYRALKDDDSIKGYRHRRFREELEDLKSLMTVIKEKI